MARATPWGAAQQVVTYTRGCAYVSTASHGGLMIAQSLALRCLSKAARNKALKYNNYYCYEEDARFYIPLFDSLFLRPLILVDIPYFKDKTPDRIERELIRSISYYDADYLFQVGVTPDPSQYQIYCLSRQRDRYMRARHPELVLTTWGDSETLSPGILKVRTADGKIHFVTKTSYDTMISSTRGEHFPRLRFLDRVHPPKYDNIDILCKEYILHKHAVLRQKAASVDSDNPDTLLTRLRNVTQNALNQFKELTCKHNGESPDTAEKTANSILYLVIENLPDPFGENLRPMLQ